MGLISWLLFIYPLISRNMGYNTLILAVNKYTVEFIWKTLLGPQNRYVGLRLRRRRYPPARDRLSPDGTDRYRRSHLR